MNAIAGTAAVLLAGGLSSIASADEVLEHFGDMGTSLQDATRDGVPDLVFRDTDTGEMAIVYMHESLTRPLRPADLNAVGGLFFGEGTIGAIDILDAVTDLDRRSDGGSIIVDNWGTGGTGFEATWNVTGSVVEVEVLDGGTGYHEGGLGFFDIDATGTGGAGLDLAYGTLSGTEGEVRKVTIVGGGTGYEPGAELTVMNTDLTQGSVFFLGTAHVDATGAVHQVDILTRGEGFESTPELGIIDPGNGFGAEFRAFLAGAIDTVLIVDGGDGYGADPVLTPQGPGEGFDYRMVRRGPITEATIVNPGGGYVAAPAVAMDDLAFGAVLQPVLWEDLPSSDRPLLDETGRVDLLRTDGRAIPALKGHSDRWHTYPGDIDGDGDLDFIWRRSFRQEDNQRLQIWLMDGGSLAQTINLDAPGKNWTPWKLADINGDWKEDLLWWNSGSGAVMAWNIDPSVPGNVGPETWQADCGGENPWDWRPWVVRRGHADEGDGLVWRHKGNDPRIRLTDYIERAGELVASVSVPRDSDGAMIVPDDAWKPWRSGDLNGDGLMGDIIGIDWSDRSLSVWQMDGDAWLGSGDLATSEREIKEEGRPRSIVTHDDGDITLGLTNGRLVTLGATGPVVADASEDDQASLQAIADAYTGAEDADDIDAATDQLDAVLTLNAALVPYLQQPRVAHAYFGELSDYIRHEISGVLQAHRPWSRSTDAGAYTVASYVATTMSGDVSVTTPELQPLPEEDDDAGSGSGSGGSSGSNGGGSSGGGSDAGGGDDAGGGGSGGGGGDAFDPCNTDLDDPSTWPPGVDTEQEYEDWLLQNVFWIAQNCN